MFNKLLAFLQVLFQSYINWCRGPSQLPSQNVGSITRDAAKLMESDYATTYLVKEFIIVGKGITYVWWRALGVMDYKLHKIAYHTGDTVYFDGYNCKVLWVVDSAGKRWS